MAKLPLQKQRVQAALAGKVTDAQTLKTVPGVQVKITAFPAAFQKVIDGQKVRHGAAWDSLKERVDLTTTTGDGDFRFINLPVGAYTLSLSMPASPHRYGSTTTAVTVTMNADGKYTTPLAAASLPPTAIKGKIYRYVPASPGNPATTTPLWMAEVRAKGSEEYTYSSSTGDFYLTGVEPGPRTFLVTAPGFQMGAAAITVVTGTVAAPTPNPFVIYP